LFPTPRKYVYLYLTDFNKRIIIVSYPSFVLGIYLIDLHTTRFYLKYIAPRTLQTRPSHAPFYNLGFLMSD
jgi:hypothetical protein